jgi:hypothetical protein
MRKAWLLASGLLLAGCGGGGSFWITLSFPDTSSREQTRSIHIATLEPGPAADCETLIDGSAKPGDNGYTVESEISFAFPPSGAVEPLKDVGPGDRLFFAEARDGTGRAILRGCTAARAGGGGLQEVSIALVWLCRPTNGGVETCDDIDNDCDGQTDEADPAAMCPAVNRARATACSRGVCGYTCDAEFANPNGEWSDGCECHLTRDGEEWCDGLDNDCDGVTDNAPCASCATSADCVHDPSCLDGECQNGACIATVRADGARCDDRSLCTEKDACAQGVCQGAAIECGDQNPCTNDGCDPATGCTHAFHTLSCDDGNACTSGDTCDGAGHCAGNPVECQSPPANTCLDASTARQFEATGNCEPPDGQCRYNYQDIPCPLGCLNGFCRSSQCQGLPAGTECDDGDACTEKDACDDNELCRGASLSCDDGNICTRDGCNRNSGCTHEPQTGVLCDDNVFCNGTDVCQNGVCTHTGDPCRTGTACNNTCNESNRNCLSPANSPCDDRLFCTATDRCNGSGLCVGSGDPCAGGLPCHDRCNETTLSCNAMEGDPCDDGIRCTEDDACDANLVCAGIPNDIHCLDPGQICAPACRLDSTGCLAPPDMTVDCPGGESSSPMACRIQLGNLPGQDACLSCRVWVEPVVLSRVDFESDTNPGVCDLDGWELVSGGTEPCNPESYLNGCPVRISVPIECCATWTCPAQHGSLTGSIALEYNPGPCNINNLKLRRLFDLSEFDGAKLCYEATHYQATGSRDYYQVHIGSAGDPDGDIPLSCMRGGSIPNTLTRFCHDISGSVHDWNPMQITFWMLTAYSNHYMFLDNILLTAWYAGCPPAGKTFFSETFEDCPGQVLPGWNGWEVSGSFPQCDTTICDTNFVEVQNSIPVTLEHAVDTTGGTSGIHVELCWSLGDDGPTDGTFRVEFSTAGTFQTAYEVTGNLGPDYVCSERCVDLSDLDPAAANNPNLRIRFSWTVQSRKAALDDIVVREVGSRCDAGELGHVITSDVSASAPGTYEIQILNQRQRTIRGTLECVWNGGGTAVKASDTFVLSN